MHPDSKVIDDLGGPAKVCELLAYDKAKGGLQRVHNWRVRGIPAKVKLERPDLFLAGSLLATATEGERRAA